MILADIIRKNEFCKDPLNKSKLAALPNAANFDLLLLYQRFTERVRTVPLFFGERERKRCFQLVYKGVRLRAVVI